MRSRLRGRLSLGERIRLARERSGDVLHVLLLDGPGVLWSKARHLFRREELNFQREYASFVGRVVADNAGGSLSPGTRVAGFSLTHPNLSYQALTRREQVWAVPESLPPICAALAFFGGLAWSTADAADPADGAIAVSGGTVMAELVMLALLVLGRRDVFWLDRPQGRGTLLGLPFLDSVREAEPSADIGTVIATKPDGPQSSCRPRKAIGCDVDADELAAQFPGAQVKLPLMIREITESRTNRYDLFYDDGPCEYPPWFDAANCGRYLTAVSNLVPLPEHGDAKRQVIERFTFERLGPRPEPGAAVRVVPARGGIGVGLIGGGRWPLGMIVRRMISQRDVALRVVADRRPEVACLAKMALSFETATTRPDDVIKSRLCDVVVVSPYHGTHANFAAAALRAGKHCFVEKPPIVSRVQFEDLATAAVASAKILHVGYNRPFAPATRVLCRHLARESGPLTMNFFMRSVDIPPNSWYYWPCNGNRVISNVCHLIDYAIFLASHTDPVQVVATPAVVGRKDLNITVTLLFADGTIANAVYTNRGGTANGYFQKYIVARGSLFGEIENFRELVVRRQSRVVARWRGVLDIGHRRQVDEFIGAVRAGGPPPMPLRHTLISALTLLATSESAETGKPVTIDVAEVDTLLRTKSFSGTAAA